MKKRAYRSINVKKVDSVKLLADIGNQKIAVGVDVAKTTFFAGFMNEQNEIHTTVKWQLSAGLACAAPCLLTIGNIR
jgi:hypothetical protein